MRYQVTDWADRDLWDCLLQRVQIHHGTLQITKVAAHLPVHGMVTEQSAFETHWNRVADTAAKAAR